MEEKPHVSHLSSQPQTRSGPSLGQSAGPVRAGRAGKTGKGSVVLMSEEEFSGWQETVHLLSSPRNAERLLRSIRDIERGAVIERALLEPQGMPSA
ncbi:type II toxin-antitoxin system Phd/YefM family antitoxin [Komagataeibacter medellinensis]|uniref:type II toxin-antitoxin system Phd/YefM family antitoxin n=1 Tax=Komagataeibacter medellinensis TaxID=1177712 RepID=UPI001E5721AA|nr:type II toxin-antitoxin system Phd/YefM family antitoxin [Komagataeibacter medellinensis]